MPKDAPLNARRILLIGGRGSVWSGLDDELARAGASLTGWASDADEPVPDVDLALVPVPGPDSSGDRPGDSAGGNGRIRQLRERLGAIPLVAVCPRADLSSGIAALHAGADEYVTLPPDPTEWTGRLERLLERGALDSRLALFRDELTRKPTLRTIEASSPAMRDVVRRIHRVAPLRSTVLIYGESGVGKELVARSIHLASHRADAPFVALNCAAIPSSLIESELFGHERGAFTGAHARVRGKFEIAHGGTLFLDEIGEMELECQAKLLRVLEEREFMRVGGTRNVHVDVRVIAATNAPLEERVESRAFRGDLYYRLKVITIHVPPLRERRRDIPALMESFMEQICRANAIPPRPLAESAREALIAHHWPGNVRELKNVLESLIVSASGPTIERDDLPPSIASRSTVAADDEPLLTLENMERELILRALERTGGNRTHSAELLGIGVRTLQRKIHAFGIRIPSTKRRRRRNR